MVENALNAWGTEREMPQFKGKTFEDLYHAETKQRHDK